MSRYKVNKSIRDINAKIKAGKVVVATAEEIIDIVKSDGPEEAARQVDGVEGVHRVIADYVGPQVRAELHVEVDGNTSFHNAHRTSNAVRDAVQALDAVDLAFVHLEPAQGQPGEPS